jgi:hypothetical protein
MGNSRHAEMDKKKPKKDNGKKREESREEKLGKNKKMPANVKKDQDRKDFKGKMGKY